MKKEKWLTDGSNLTDQEFLLRWAEVGAHTHCKPRDVTYIINCLKRAKERISGIIRKDD